MSCFVICMAWVLCICILAALMAQISCLELAWHDGINPHNIPVLAVSRGPSEKGCCMIWLPLKPLQRSKALGTWSFSNFQQQKSANAKTSCHFFRPPDFTKADMHFWNLPIVNSSDIPHPTDFRSKPGYHRAWQLPEPPDLQLTDQLPKSPEEAMLHRFWL